MRPSARALLTALAAIPLLSAPARALAEAPVPPAAPSPAAPGCLVPPAARPAQPEIGRAPPRLRPLFAARYGTPLGPSAALGLARSGPEGGDLGTWSGPHLVGEVGPGGWKAGAGPMAGGGDVIAAGLRLAVLRTFDRPSAGRPNSTYVGAEAGLSLFHLDVTAGFFLASKAGPGSDVVGALSIGLGNAP